MKHIIIGTAGHIDHGKSALVEALTGTNPDRLEEERRRGITIDLGFAFLDAGGVHMGMVDVPGHERFVRNMLAGVGGVDLVLLVIAADECIKPQTREHFDICRLLGIQRGVIALTKADLVEPDHLGLVRLEVEEFIRGSFLDGAPIRAVSARTGAGLKELEQALVQVAGEAPAKDASRYFRLPIDRAFAMKGFGTVVTGTLVSGEVRPEDEVELFPARRRVRVRGVQSGGRAVGRAVAGQRTALNLAGVELAELRRGMSLASPGLFEVTARVDVRLELLGSSCKLKNRRRVHFHQGTAETVADVVLLDRSEVAPGETAFAQLRLAQPVLLLPGDRFILRQFSPVVTMGGGGVLDPLAPRHRMRAASAIPHLETIARGNHAEILAAMLTRAPSGLDHKQITARTGWLEREIRESASLLAAAGAVRILSEHPLVIAASESLRACAAEICAELETFHKANPLVEGMPREDLRTRVAARNRAELFRAALRDLVSAGEVSLVGDLVKRRGRDIALLPEEQRAKEQIEAAFAEAGLTVPSVPEVLARLPVEPKRAQKLLHLLLREQVLVRVSGELIFHLSAIKDLRLRLAEHKKRKGEKLSVAVFKELTGVSRKYAIPLLEFMDRERVTRRVGDERVIL